MELQLAQNAECLLGRERLVEGRGLMGVQVVLHQADRLRLRKGHIHQPLQAAGIVLFRAALGHDNVAPAHQGFHHHEEIGCALSLVFVIISFGSAWGHRQAGTSLGMQDEGFLIEADQRVLGSVLSRIFLQHIFHGGNELGSHSRDAPLLMLPGFERILLKRARMVSGEMAAMHDRLQASPVVVRQGNSGGHWRQRRGGHESLLSCS